MLKDSYKLSQNRNNVILFSFQSLGDIKIYFTFIEMELNFHLFCKNGSFKKLQQTYQLLIFEIHFCNSKVQNVITWKKSIIIVNHIYMKEKNGGNGKFQV